MFFFVQSKIAMEHAPLFVDYSTLLQKLFGGYRNGQTHIIIWAHDFSPFKWTMEPPTSA